MTHLTPALCGFALDLLLANLGNPEVVTSPIGEYASENPVKPRPYEVLLEELVEE